MRTLKKTFADFRSRQDGSATIEFVILFPGIMTLFLMGFEAGYYMVRNVALERAVDIAIFTARAFSSHPKKKKVGICIEHRSNIINRSKRCNSIAS